MWKKSIMYIQNILKSFLLLFLQLEGNVIFQEKNAHTHNANANSMFCKDAQQLPWLARLLICLSLNMCGDNSWFFNLAYPKHLLYCMNKCKVWNNLWQNCIHHLWNHKNSRALSRVNTQRGYSVIIWHLNTVDTFLVLEPMHILNSKRIYCNSVICNYCNCCLYIIILSQMKCTFRMYQFYLLSVYLYKVSSPSFKMENIFSFNPQLKQIITHRDLYNLHEILDCRKKNIHFHHLEKPILFESKE